MSGPASLPHSPLRELAILDGCPGCIRFLRWLAARDLLPSDARTLARYFFEHPAGHSGPIAIELGVSGIVAPTISRPERTRTH